MYNHVSCVIVTIMTFCHWWVTVTLSSELFDDVAWSELHRWEFNTMSCEIPHYQALLYLHNFFFSKLKRDCAKQFWSVPFLGPYHFWSVPFFGPYLEWRFIFGPYLFLFRTIFSTVDPNLLVLQHSNSFQHGSRHSQHDNGHSRWELSLDSKIHDIRPQWCRTKSVSCNWWQSYPSLFPTRATHYRSTSVFPGKMYIQIW